MSSAEQHQIHELIALYQLEPELRDVFVEGSFDASFIEWFLREVGAKNALVKEIETVDIPAEMVNELGLENNCRGRVFTLAHQVQREMLGEDLINVTCVVDSDFDRILQCEYSYKVLLLTDYSCLEAYLFLVKPIAKFLALVVRRFPKTAERLLEEIREPLVDLFAIRLANHRLRWNLRIIPFEGCCTLHAAGIRLDSAEYIHRLLNANNRACDRATFLTITGESRQMLTKKHRHYVHGHDFIDMLCLYLRQHRGCRGIHKEVIERSIFACAEVQDLSQEPMFRTLMNRVGERADGRGSSVLP